MPPGVRRLVAVVAGLLVGASIVMLSDGLVAHIAPFPNGTNVHDLPNAVRAAMAAVPLYALIIKARCAGWAIAIGAAAFVAVRLAPARRIVVGLSVTVVFLVGMIANLTSLPHPFWMWPAALILAPLLGWTGARAAALPPPAVTP